VRFVPGAASGNGSAGPVPVIEIGGTHVTAALVELAEARLVAGDRRRLGLEPHASAEEILNTILDCAGSLRAPSQATWGVATPGPFDYDSGTALFSEVGKFDQLYGTNVREALMAGLPRPPGRIVFLNDAHAFFWGERLFGVAADQDPCVALTLGTGVGSAFFAGGALRETGPGVPPGGRADLLRVHGVPLEDVVSTRAIEKAYRQRTGTAPKGVAAVVELSRSGDLAAKQVLWAAFESLGRALRPYLADLGARMLVVGGAMARSWDLVEPALLHGIHGGGTARLAGLAVAMAGRLEDATLLGAAACAIGTLASRHLASTYPPGTVPDQDPRAERGRAGP